MVNQKVDVVNELYIPLLNAIHIYSNENGELFRRAGGVEKPCELEGKQLILPTTDNLQRANDKQFIFFHPLSENIARGDSAVYNYLKLAVILRINYTITSLADMLIHVAGDKQLDGKLKSAQLDLLRAVPKVNDKTISNLVSSFLKMDLDKNMFYTVYNKRNGKIGSNTYNRVAVTRFPLLEQLNDIEKSPYWSAVKGIRKADVQAYQDLFAYLIPNWNIDNQYSGFSDSMEAPGFHALGTAFVSIMSRLNELSNLFADVVDTREMACPDLHVIDQALGNLQRFANVISPLPGNTGDIAENNTNVNQLQTQPMGVPPANLMAAAETKAAAIKGNEPVQPIQPVTQWPQAPAQPATQQPVQPQQQPQGQFIGLPNPQYNMYGNPYMPQMQQPNPYLGNNLGYGGYNPQLQQQQAMYAQQQQLLAQQQQQRMASDPIAQWNAATQQQPTYTVNAYGQPVNAYGQPVMMPQQQQGFIGQQRPAFPVMGQQPMLQQQQPQMPQPMGFGMPKFNTI